MYYQVGPGASCAALLWDTITLDMIFRIWIEKILLVLAIRNLDENTIANKIYKEQKSNKWPGLATETKQICQELGIQDCNETFLSKQDYKKIVMEACHQKNKEKLLLSAKGKCERLQWEDYEKKEYISKKTIQSVRVQFRSRFGLQRFAGNYSHNRSFASSNWLCNCLESREEENH